MNPKISNNLTFKKGIYFEIIELDLFSDTEGEKYIIQRKIALHKPYFFVIKNSFTGYFCRIEERYFIYIFEIDSHSLVIKKHVFDENIDNLYFLDVLLQSFEIDSSLFFKRYELFLKPFLIDFNQFEIKI